VSLRVSALIGVGVFAAAVLAGCATERPYVWVQSLPATFNQNDADGTIHARDSIVVVVRDQASMSGEFVVREDGAYLQPPLGNVSVEGKTPAQVESELQGRLKDMVVNAQVTVTLARTAPVKVSVVGEVKTPGAYELGRDHSVTAALALAGWITDFAAKDRIFVVRRGSNNGDVRVRFRALDITASESHSASFRLRDGDVVVVE
jgi:polysaccharide export outer membrane protein